MPADSQYSPLPAGYDPSPDDVCAAVSRCWDYGDEFGSDVVFAGLGDPLLRLDALSESARLVAAANPGREVSFRANTNGLYADPGAVARTLRDAGVGGVAVALNYSDEDLYEENMWAPSHRHESNSQVIDRPFETACGFVKAAAAEEGMRVTVTAVDNGVSDVEKVRSLAFELGADDFKVRSFFP